MWVSRLVYLIYMQVSYLFFPTLEPIVREKFIGKELSESGKRATKRITICGSGYLYCLFQFHVSGFCRGGYNAGTAFVVNLIELKPVFQNVHSDANPTVSSEITYGILVKHSSSMKTIFLISEVWQSHLREKLEKSSTSTASQFVYVGPLQ